MWPLDIWRHGTEEGKVSCLEIVQSDFDMFATSVFYLLVEPLSVRWGACRTYF